MSLNAGQSFLDSYRRRYKEAVREAWLRVAWDATWAASVGFCIAMATGNWWLGGAAFTTVMALYSVGQP